MYVAGTFYFRLSPEACNLATALYALSRTIFFKGVGKMKFQHGQIVITPAALAALSEAGITPLSLLLRHLDGDWGDLCAEDKLANEAALRSSMRIFSSYLVGGNLKIWIITEADRSSTCILLPDDY